jgi:polyhydroxyalkanoate synthesis regulator phasin
MATTKTTRKTTRKTTTTTSKPRSRAAQRLAEQSTSRPPFAILSEAAVKGVKFGIGTTLVVRDTVKKFFDDAVARGNEVELTVPTLPMPNLNLPTPQDIERQVSKLSEMPVAQIRQVTEHLQKFFDGLVRQLTELTTPRSKKAALDKEALREEVLNVVASLDLANGSDIKRILNQVEKMSRKLDKEIKAPTRRKAEPAGEPTPAVA